MRKQDHLIGLINSLNANEKRHFRLFAAQQQDDTNYLKLFDALEGKEAYNAAALSRELKIPQAQLHKSKNYLAKALLKSLRVYKDGASIYAKLCNSLLEMEELIARRLYDYAVEVADKAVAYAEEHDRLDFVLPILNLKLDICLWTANYNEIALIDEKMRAAMNVTVQHHEIHYMWVLVDQFVRSQKPKEDFLYHNHPILHINPENLLTRFSMHMWFTMMNSYMIALKKDPAQALANVKEHIAFYESNPDLINDGPRQYVNSNSWLIYIEMQCGNYENGWQASEKLLQAINSVGKKMKRGSMDDAVEYAHTTRSALSFFLGRYAESLQTAENMNAQKHKMNDHMRFTVVFTYAKVLLHNHRSADAMDSLEELLQIENYLYPDLQPYLRPLMILAQLDLGNHQVVPYQVKSTRAWMKRQKINNPEVDLFLSHAYAIAKAPVSKRKAEWVKLLNAVEKGSMGLLDKELHLCRWIKEFVR